MKATLLPVACPRIRVTVKPNVSIHRILQRGPFVLRQFNMIALMALPEDKTYGVYKRVHYVDLNFAPLPAGSTVASIKAELGKTKSVLLPAISVMHNIANPEFSKRRPNITIWQDWMGRDCYFAFKWKNAQPAAYCDFVPSTGFTDTCLIGTVKNELEFLRSDMFEPLTDKELKRLMKMKKTGAELPDGLE